MATEVVSIIDPDAGSGYDYDSLYDWEAAEQGDLTGVRDEIAVAKCRCTGGTADTTSITINGWTTSETKYIKIWTDPAESYRHNGTWQTGNKYRIDSNSGSWNTITNEEDYVTIEGLQIDNHETVVGRGILTTGAYTKILKCIIKSSAETCSTPTGILLDGTNGIVVNCIVYGFNQSTGSGIYSNNDTNSKVYNNTSFNNYNGFGTSWTETSRVWKNNIGYGNSNVDFDNILVTYNTCQYNASEDSSASGTGCRNNQTFAFVDYSGNNVHLSSTDTGALGYGANLYNDATYPFQDDIDGDDRGGSGASWDIGADEYVGASAVPKIMLLQDHFSGGIH